MPDTLLAEFATATFGGWLRCRGDVEGVDDGGAVVDAEPVVVAEEADFDAGPALVDV